MRFASYALASCLFSLSLGLSAPADAAERVGYGRLVTNDLIGDGGDRWQSGSYSASYAFSKNAWDGALPARPGDVFEFRLDASLMSPEYLREPEAGDRPLAGRLRLGVGTQFQFSGLETDMAAYLDLVGPETGLVDLQTGLHDELPGAPTPSKRVRDNQVDLDPGLGASVELAKSLSLGSSTLRPFVAVETGAETFARAGFDFTFGSFGSGGMQTRDMVSGHRYRVIPGEGQGVSFVIGADTTQITDTQLLREKDGVDAEEIRHRARAGVHWQGARGNYFYGLTYLSPETEYQDGEGQVTGSVRLDWQF